MRMFLIGCAAAFAAGSAMIGAAGITGLASGSGNDAFVATCKKSMGEIARWGDGSTQEKALISFVSNRACACTRETFEPELEEDQLAVVGEWFALQMKISFTHHADERQRRNFKRVAETFLRQNRHKLKQISNLEKQSRETIRICRKKIEL